MLMDEAHSPEFGALGTDRVRAHRERLSAHLEAIRLLFPEISTADVADSMRRIARSVRTSGSATEFPALQAAASAVETCSDETLPEQLEELIGQLDEAVSARQGAKATILVVTDESETAVMIRQALEASSRRVLVTESGLAAERFLAEEAVSLVILDLILPDLDGRHLILKIREWSRTQHLPVLAFSVPQPSIQAECMALGVDQFFEKPLDPNELAAAVKTRLKSSFEETGATLDDPLTGLPSRARLRSEFLRTRALARRLGKPLSLALFDLDHFKQVNDTHGHATGDNVLLRFASIVSGCFRETDVLGRWGGEEFLAFFPGTTAPGALAAVSKALKLFRLEPFPPSNGEGRPFHVTFSAGITRVKEDESLNEAVARADHRLYLAKRAGRACFFGPDTPSTDVRLRILVVEDDEIQVRLLSRMLTQEGFEVDHVGTGHQAVTRAKQQTYSLVILDGKLPNMSGFEVLEELREMPHFRRTPIIMLTQMGREEDIVRAFDLGADDYVLKPLRPATFLARVRRLLRSV